MATLSAMWKDAKKSFESITGKSKPKESKGLANAFGSHTGLSGSLEKFDKLDAASVATDNRSPADCAKGQKIVKEMQSTLASFAKASTAYSGVLSKTIAGEIDKRTELEAKTTYERALKMLTKSLTAIEDTAEARIKAAQQRFDAAEKDLGMKQKMLNNWKKNMTGAVARGIAGAAKVKAKPTVEVYNSIFPTAARDITMQLVFAKDIDGLLADPTPILKSMNPWASQSGGAPARLPTTATEADVKKYLAGFIAELKKADKLVSTKDAYS
ncbi:hypothetical protein [Sphingomonas jatrophae]|uniref:Uncharacterized protein n=1 Tax=Sphingomonas jatrophae TaxID=1166337 RepID=A0A1I6JXK2_9SPHN|nr:hypothetical protein [Sphingomonas jatrophae]SFR83260.1 hypothetical protein SAMN05192580_0987 [Sphingomonas jatrophae]